MLSPVILRPPVVMDAIATFTASQFVTPTIKTIRLRLHVPEFRFLPGQAVWPRFTREGRTFSKIYSMASSPDLCPDLDLCVSRVGWSSAYLQDLPVGQDISLRGPYGLLTLDRLPDRPVLYVAEGSGIAPLKSHLDWLSGQGHRLPVALVQANPETPDCLPYADHWQALGDRWPAFRYYPVTQGTLENVLAQVPWDWPGGTVYLCGVGDRVEALQMALLGLGVAADRLRSEKFFAF